MATFDYATVPLAPSSLTSPTSSQSQEKYIRLLTIHPAQNLSGPIVCGIRAVKLSEAPKYEALSYTWRPVNPLHPIKLNKRVFQVQHNLFLALQRLRRQDWPRVIWIDAICNDQSNIPERNSTVSFMRDIYASARGGVVVWMGEEGPDTHLVQPLLDRLCEFAEYDEPLNPTIRSRLSKWKSSSPGLPDVTDSGYRALYNLLLTPWSSRVWVVQEVVMAPHNLEITIQRGSHTFCMERIARAFGPIYKYNIETLLQFTFPARFCTLWGERLAKKNKPDLLDIIIRNWLTYATDPRDKIYAFIGLTDDFDVTIDYDPSVTVEQVFTDFARKYISKSRNLAILGTLSSTTVGRHGFLPSWVPDWTVWKPHTFTFTERSNGTEAKKIQHFTAAGNCSNEFTLDIDGAAANQLQLEGHIIDTIEDVGPISRRECTLTERLEFFRESEYTAEVQGEYTVLEALDRFHGHEAVGFNGKKRYPHTGELLLIAYYSTLIMDDLYHTFDAKPKRHSWINRSRSLHQTYRDFHCRIHELLDTPLGWDMDPFLARDFANHYCQEATAVNANRRLVRTKDKKYLGVFSERVQVGDSIVLLKGARVPFAIRKQPGSIGPWQIVGDGYLHGAMGGEAWKKDECAKFVFE
ncbi:heterokaryon incompatibility protein-domain-containing protein [Thelonectria olida]|uniref:Heterokaryon incompatibility protein-domain-containing protein n=1 Tax=Thelonectria olida TaxID=1576542 RepID=A0A9P8WEV8_9HYPO|nr:heterokaryon incompatibility protein-domain-containing protein [Thelonectria olida]